MFVNSAIQCQRSADREFHNFFVENGESSGEAEADGAGVGIRGVSKLRGAAAKNLRACEKLRVDFQPNNRLVFGRDLRGDCTLF